MKRAVFSTLFKSRRYKTSRVKDYLQKWKVQNTPCFILSSKVEGAKHHVFHTIFKRRRYKTSRVKRSCKITKVQNTRVSWSCRFTKVQNTRVSWSCKITKMQTPRVKYLCNIAMRFGDCLNGCLFQLKGNCFVCSVFNIIR